jgi:hypothetical protein
MQSSLACSRLVEMNAALLPRQKRLSGLNGGMEISKNAIGKTALRN